MSASAAVAAAVSATPAYKIASLYTGPGSATVAAGASALTMSLAAVTILATLF